MSDWHKRREELGIDIKPQCKHRDIQHDHQQHYDTGWCADCVLGLLENIWDLRPAEDLLNVIAIAVEEVQEKSNEG